MNKKSLSNVVATVLIIALALTAVGLIFQFSMSMVENVEEAKLSPVYCSQLSNEVSIKNIEYSPGSDQVNIEISKFSEKEIDRIDFTLVRGDNKSTWTCSNSCQNCQPQDSAHKEYVIGVDNRPDKVEVRVNNCLVDEEEMG